VADFAEIFDALRAEIGATVSGLSEDELLRELPATPGWTAKDVVCHLTGDAVAVLAADFPTEFFQSLGDEAAIRVLNEWTMTHVTERSDLPLEAILKEWDEVSRPITAMMRGEESWPGGVPSFADRVLITDATVHRQDIFGAFGIVKDRSDAPIRISLSSYIAITGMRLGTDGIAPLRFEVEDKTYDIGEGGPGATVKATRFEFFRALSGRRSPDQVRAYEWSGDPEPYIPYFYPYGVRPDALVE
jgi:uncharacterized protein (TIGR03083 family)